MRVRSGNGDRFTPRLATALIAGVVLLSVVGIAAFSWLYEAPVPLPKFSVPPGRLQTHSPFFQEAASPAAPPIKISTSLDRTASVVRYLIDAGLSAAEASRWAGLFTRVTHSRQMEQGHPLTLFKDPETGALRGFKYNLNYRATVTELGLGGGLVRIWRQPIEYMIRPVGVSFQVHGNFVRAAAANGVPSQIVRTLDKAFASRYPLDKLASGTTVKLLYREKVSRDGTWHLPAGLEAASLDLMNGKELDAFAFSDGSNGTHLYDAQGRSLDVQTLKFPVAFKYISSGFTYSRYHPILHIYRPHLGVDLATDYGAPVKAIGDGTVQEAGWCGELGRCIRIKHPGGMTSVYGHLSRVRVTAGSAVHVGQVIGNVGSSGLSTGAHLHFAIEKGDTFVNPLTQRLGGAHEIPPAMHEMFVRLKNRYEAALSHLPAFGSRVGQARPTSGPEMAADEAGAHFASGRIHERRRHRWRAERTTVVDYEGGL
jgi:murein DD-endopeptidase MepM/ murein hydrolase activator NlpD